LAGGQPEYPRLAILTRTPGRVVLRAVITVDGLVDQVEVLHAPATDLGFVEAAIEAVSEWRYEPGQLHGRPVAVAFTVVVEFKLQ
jgi:protein TonB